ncbi:hypothetical protein BKP45_08745 [Anaerobacillus alkalidiazotrophicus]|uniref:Uncharacterized protein n=1 Tax=Anaerobacillus alkalidiazotrophicus TaxID=472963 RepID=A0A1S2M7T2_9BACI|nr:hypothetical protein [Anaerobacillus alkalidiazotrophicus]OIJ20563.1 hypothetical protein BKP45_08745 [Anaerobacillus alkalidiazotrophicus]
MMPYPPYTYRQLQQYQLTEPQLLPISPRLMSQIPPQVRRVVPSIPSNLIPYVTPRVIARINQADPNRWLECGDYCEKECGLGNPLCYGACYWHCIIRGGPPELPIQPYPYVLR